MKTVSIYSSPTCHFCHMAKAFFAEHNIQFTDHDVATDPDAIKEAVEKSGQMGVPVIDIDGEIVLGFDEPKLKQLLGIS
jgi:glutaredoxin 3